MPIVRLVICLAVFCFSAGAACAIDLAGGVERLRGSAIATGTTGFSRPLQEGSTLLVGDRITTGADSRLRIRFNDGASITLGGSSTMTVEVYDEDGPDGRGVLGIVDGVFLAVTGAIAKLGTDRFVINTPSATLGVRGTEVWGDQLPDRLAVAMLSGTGVAITTPLGTVELTQPLQGVDVVAGEPLPEPKTWGSARLDNAHREVAFEDE